MNGDDGDDDDSTDLNVSPLCNATSALLRFSTGPPDEY
jgi:hypothetical protein